MTSIIMLVWNQLKYTQQCVDSIFKYTSAVKTPFELIIVNNGSTDGTREYLDQLKVSVYGSYITIIHNEKNEGYPKGNNIGAKAAKGDTLLLLNNDTIVSEGWLVNLLRCLRSDNKIAAVGPYTNHASGYQKSPVPTPYRGNEELAKFAEKYNQPEREVDFLVFFCILLKRSVWDEIGGLDEEFTPGNYEDNYWCFRAVEKGYKLKIAGNAYVHHFSGKTFGEDPQSKQKYYSLIAKNQRLFTKKICRYASISLCMIVGDYEDEKIVRRCLDSVAEWIDEICFMVNYKKFPNPWKLDKYKDILLDYRQRYRVHGKIDYLKWTNFSDMRNKSLDMASGDWCLWLDADDVLLNPNGMRDMIWRHWGEYAGFRFRLHSKTEIGTQEVIFHTNLFKNDKRYRFRGRVHEDIMPSFSAAGAKLLTTDITVQHLGYLNYKTWKKKNIRNHKLILEDLKENPTSLTYYHLVNSLLIMGGVENVSKAVKYIDECFDRFKLTKEDALTPKMWVLRGVACMDAGQHLAAKQSLHKGWDEWKHPEAGVNLAELYIREKNYDKALEILEAIYAMKEFQITNIPFDAVQAECLMLEKLGDTYYQKALLEAKDAKKNPEGAVV